MSIQFTTETAPVVTRVTEENPFLNVVAEMPLTGEGKDHTGADMVPTGTPGGARGFVLEGSNIARGEGSNPLLAKAIRQLNAAAEQRPGGKVTVLKKVDVVKDPKTGKDVKPAQVKVTFYLVPKRYKSKSA